MKKIIYYTFYSEDGSDYYRSAGVFPYIKSKDFELVNLSHIKELGFSNLLGYDAIFIVRPHEEKHLNLIRMAKDCGLKVIIDHDDNPLCLPNHHPLKGFFNASKKNILSAVALADEVWVSTEAIKTAFKLYNRNIHVIPNAHNDYLFKVEDKKPFVFNRVAMWRGGLSHIGDIYEPGVSEKLVELVNRNQDWKFFFLGQRFDWIEMHLTGNNCYRHDGATTIQFYKLMHEYNPCIFFYPLNNNLFNQSKSNCSWLESTYSGAAYFGNKDLPEFDKDCIFDLKLLKEGIEGSHHEGLAKANKESWELICDEYLLSKVNKLRLKRIEKLFEI